MRNKNVLIILIILVLIVLVAATSVIFKSQPEVLPDAGSIVKVDGSAATAEPTAALSAEATAEPAAEATAEGVATASDAAAQEESSDALTGAGYVYITAGGEARWFELPAEEAKLEITRTASDGTEIFNVVNLSPEGVFVESASCDNQDCVEQGTVTLENKEERVLRNLIVCLPNEVSVELYSAEEVAQMLIEQSQQMSE